jgi:hypothetical protein
MLPLTSTKVESKSTEHTQLTTYSQSDLETLGPRSTMLKNLHGHTIWEGAQKIKLLTHLDYKSSSSGFQYIGNGKYGA